MAVRNPLYFSSGNLREMSSSQVSDIINYTIYQYSLNPSVVLNIVSSGGSLGTIRDTRMQAGGALIRADRFATPAESPDISEVRINQSRINQTVASTTEPANTGSIAFPVYYDGNNIRAMSTTDIYDTFITPAINTLVSGSISSSQAGTYRIGGANQSSISGHTLIGTAFVDTRANVGAYTAGGIPETLDQPTTIATFSLFRIDGVSSSFVMPVQANSGGSVKTYASSTFESLISGFIRHAAANVTGSRIRYSYSSGTNRGSGMTDTRTPGPGTYRQRFVNADDYRIQDHPSGSPFVNNTYYLKIGKS